MYGPLNRVYTPLPGTSKRTRVSQTTDHKSGSSDEEGAMTKQTSDSEEEDNATSDDEPHRMVVMPTSNMPTLHPEGLLEDCAQVDNNITHAGPSSPSQSKDKTASGTGSSSSPTSSSSTTSSSEASLSSSSSSSNEPVDVAKDGLHDVDFEKDMAASSKALDAHETKAANLTILPESPYLCPPKQHEGTTIRLMLT